MLSTAFPRNSGKSNRNRSNKGRSSQEVLWPLGSYVPPAIVLPIVVNGTESDFIQGAKTASEMRKYVRVILGAVEDPGPVDMFVLARLLGLVIHFGGHHADSGPFSEAYYVRSYRDEPTAGRIYLREFLKAEAAQRVLANLIGWHLGLTARGIHLGKSEKEATSKLKRWEEILLSEAAKNGARQKAKVTHDASN